MGKLLPDLGNTGKAKNATGIRGLNTHKKISPYGEIPECQITLHFFQDDDY